MTLTDDLGTMEPGIYTDMPEEDYHAATGLNWSRMKMMVYQTPAHAMLSEQKEKPHLDVGKAVHCIILKPHDFEAKFAKGPDNRRGNQWKAALETAGSKTLLLAQDHEFVCRMRDAVQANSDINKLVMSNNRMAEVSGFWARGDILCKCRWDLVIDDGAIVVDLKSTVDASPAGFAKAIANFGYHGQDFWYSSAARTLFGIEQPQFLFIAVEKEKPFASAVYELDLITKIEGKALADRAFELYRQFEPTGEWPAYPPGVQQLTLPRWGYRITSPLL